MSFSGSKQLIPRDIIFEIFSWLPVKSLMRFKCLSKYCNPLISGSYFVDIHRCRSMTRPSGTKFFVHDVNDFYTSELPEDGKVSLSLFQTEKFNGLYCSLGSSLNCVNGLFCICEPLSMERGVIFSPSTREVRFVPDLNKDISWCNYSLGFEEEENKYKIHYSLGFEAEEQKYKVLLSAGHVRERYRKHWILTLGIDESWRETKNISSDIIYRMPGVCINGVIYQFAKVDNKRAIAAFDIKSEKFNIIAWWNSSQSHHHWEGDYMLIEVKGNLAVADCKNWLISGCIHLRVLEENVQWKSHTIHFPSIWNGGI